MAFTRGAPPGKAGFFLMAGHLHGRSAPGAFDTNPTPHPSKGLSEPQGSQEERCRWGTDTGFIETSRTGRTPAHTLPQGFRRLFTMWVVTCIHHG